MDTVSMSEQRVQELALEVYRRAAAAEKKGKLLPTLQEMREALAALPAESERKFELDVVSFSVKWDESVIRSELGQLIAQADAAPLPPAEEQVAFAAFCVAVNYERRMKNVSAEEALLHSWESRFSHHIFYRHMLLLSKMGRLENFRENEWDESRLRQLLELANENALALRGNVGGLHAFAETVALAYENVPEMMACIQEKDTVNWLGRAEMSVEEAIRATDYAKFHCTHARILAAGGNYDAALSRLNTAIDKEDSQRSDYAIRVGRYLTFSQLFRARKELASMEAAVQDNLVQYKEALEEQEKQTLVKNMEFLGLFSGIVSFTIGSLTISGAIAEQSIQSAAGLIVVLMGALMGVFAAFGIVLHGVTGKKALRNVFVLLLGLAAVLGGIAFCLS